MRVLVTGASGFLGGHVCRRLLEDGHEIRALSRSSAVVSGAATLSYSDKELRSIPAAAFEGIAAVVHLAARVHVRSSGRASHSAFYSANMDVTRRLAVAAAAAGVRDFLFASSLKAAAETSAAVLVESDRPRPLDAYGASKLEAEARLAEIGAAQGMNTVSLRLPLMYGAGMKANMMALFRLVDRGLPLPLGGIANRRSLLYAGNAAAVFAALLGRIAGQEMYYASDGEAVSTPELLRRIAAALKRPLRLLPAPKPLLRLAERLDLPVAGPLARRLAGSLAVDSSRLLTRLGAPLPYTLDQGLVLTASWYRGPAAGRGTGHSQHDEEPTNA
ncbi:MAG TPA: NAD-dependent epimerase/dehydratase family protein [Longimicrobiales bacterium]|nr:NAD-dependent epimerase/dehydratase family protein [Longimicrobiales bacterium]